MALRAKAFPTLPLLREPEVPMPKRALVSAIFSLVSANRSFFFIGSRTGVAGRVCDGARRTARATEAVVPSMKRGVDGARSPEAMALVLLLWLNFGSASSSKA